MYVYEYLQNYSNDIDLFLHLTVLEYENTIVLDHMLEKIRLAFYFGVTTVQCILMGMKGEIC